jgi:hypothetical protein
MKQNNFAFIDSQNLNLSIRELGWKIDWKRFRVYLKEKYFIEKAFLFIGFIEGNNALYRNKFSALLKFRIFRSFLRFLNDAEKKLSYKKEKTP